jgi:poly-gamma-glutamate capsule biosynthesis protein CapA/YwtB (metallophosphatase superfamily)
VRVAAWTTLDRPGRFRDFSAGIVHTEGAVPRRPAPPFRELALLLFAPLLASGCGKARADHEPPQPLSSAGGGAGVSAIVGDAGAIAASASGSTLVLAPPPAGTTIDVALAGDAIPQQRVLANSMSEVLAKLPAFWGAADARVLNLEGPIGDRKALPGVGDKNLLAYAGTPAWLDDLLKSSRASAFVGANNHACDLGPVGLAGTLAETTKSGAKLVGVASDDPWKRVEIVEKGGHKVCLVAWTTFLNDKGRKQKACTDGAPESGGTRVAVAEVGPAGIAKVQAELGAPGRWDGCDARIVFLHGGGEYRAQVRQVLEQATAAAAYVDAVIVSHPHVPDEVEVVAAPAAKGDAKSLAALGGRAPGRGVPLFHSLGNFISNQGHGWSVGMTSACSYDPLRNVWTRVAMFARLRFGWDAGVAAGAPPSSIKYGWSLAFTDREGPAIRLRPLPNGADDAVAKKLEKAPKPFGGLLGGACFLGENAAPVCDARHPGAARQAEPGDGALGDAGAPPSEDPAEP